MERVSIQFLQWQSLYENEKPFQIFTSLLPNAQDQRKTNLVWEEKTITVEDFRERAQKFQLDTHGFTSRQLHGFDDLSDNNIVKNVYIPAVKDMLRRELEDVGTVFVFDWRIRHSRGEAISASEQKINFSDHTQPLLPSNFAHIDISPTSIVHRIQSSFPTDTTKILRQRIRAINVWKPLIHPVDEWSLAVCDGTTVDRRDLVETDSVRQGAVSSHYYARYDARQRWYYLDHQRPDEILIFKHFDSKPGVEAPYALHSSVKHQNIAQGAKERRSIEVRTLVFSEEFHYSDII